MHIITFSHLHIGAGRERPAPPAYTASGGAPGSGSGRRAMGGRKGEKPHKFSAGVGQPPPKIAKTPPINSAKVETRVKCANVRMCK
nr:MAG TPA_asm: hypothetical protein [Caudoviricetes sp.]